MEERVIKWVASNSGNLFSHSSGGRKPDVKTAAGLQQAGPGIPWFVAVSFQPLGLWYHCLMFFCLKLPLPLSYKGTGHYI